jgi:hypothetical protein
VREFVTILFAFVMLGCSSDDSPDEDSGIYAPCDGEPGACALATSLGSSEGDFCLCTHYCDVDAECPMPATGSAVPTCTPFGDVIMDGHTASCTLPCDSKVTCPDGMECQDGECWAPIQ